MSRLRLLPLLALLSLLSPASGADDLSRDNLEKYVRTLASKDYEGRRGQGARKAEAYVADAFRACGLETSVQELALADGRTVRNVLGIRRARKAPALEHVLLGAHYDHLGMIGQVWFPGAADNAAGVAALLEAARLLPQDESRDLLLVAFDREEEGLLGSRAYCQAPALPLDQCAAAVILDILGRDLADATKGILFCSGAERSDSLFGLVKESAVPEGLRIVFSGVDIVGDRSDFAPFRDRGVPFLFFSAGEYRDYHAPTDTPARLDFDKLEREAKAILEVTRRIVAAPRAKFLEEPALRVEEAAGLADTIGQLLEKRDALGLSMSEAMMGEAFRVSLRQIADSGTLTRPQRDQLVATCRMLVLMLQRKR